MFPEIYVLSTTNLNLTYDIINYCIEYGYSDTLELIKYISQLNYIPKSNILFNSKLFYDINAKILDRREKMQNRVTISEGIYVCEVCHSHEIISFSFQSGDENISYNNICQTCGKKWTTF
jgi:DNA-directed RNA polymerase subunit M/transcription elongation factor TFIIS